MTPLDARDRRDRLITFRPESPEQKARITLAAKAEGMSAAGWIRDRLLDAAGWQDVTRRRATRRPNEQPRQEDTGTAPLVARVSAREKAAIVKRATHRRMDVSEWARDVIQAELGKEGQ